MPRENARGLELVNKSVAVEAGTLGTVPLGTQHR
jgi:hypothetical protein